MDECRFERLVKRAKAIEVCPILEREAHTLVTAKQYRANFMDMINV